MGFLLSAASSSLHNAHKSVHSLLWAPSLPRHTSIRASMLLYSIYLELIKHNIFLSSRYYYFLLFSPFKHKETGRRGGIEKLKKIWPLLSINLQLRIWVRCISKKHRKSCFCLINRVSLKYFIYLHFKIMQTIFQKHCFIQVIATYALLIKS